jgi:hypothetical protein
METFIGSPQHATHLSGTHLNQQPPCGFLKFYPRKEHFILTYMSTSKPYDHLEE